MAVKVGSVGSWGWAGALRRASTAGVPPAARALATAVSKAARVAWLSERVRKRVPSV
ncbi:MAG: hypothetical protein IPK12_03270 [Gemmatimonadetes bacterium]|nr:hypothetical protein [Gemmatimonadota bacterium]